LPTNRKKMKVEIKSKKGLRTNLSIIVDKKTIKLELDKRLIELQSEISLKGFRPGKVPPAVIKRQFGKAAYGEVVDKILKDTSTKALEENKIKVVGQPKIDLKIFGEGKDLSYTLEVDSLPEIKLKSFENFKATDYKISVDQKTIELKIDEIAKDHKNFSDKEKDEKSKLNDLIIFNYSATVDGNKFEGCEGKGVQIELGKDLFLKGFDEQLIGIKKNEKKIVEVNLPENHPKKELANKKAKFECNILNVKKAEKTIIDDNFAKNMGAKDLTDLKNLVEKQISSQYTQALDAHTKKEILEQVEKLHDFELPENLIASELASMTKNLKQEEIEKHKLNNEKLARSRIKLGLILNEFGLKNNIKVSENEINAEINKQIQGMPGQEKMVMDYYKKNPNAAQSLQGAIYENKIITLLKSKIKINVKNLSMQEAEQIINKSVKSKSIDKNLKKTTTTKKTKTKK